jgi:16S rRNA (uracil1498-N3)-methyltransferase
MALPHGETSWGPFRTLDSAALPGAAPDRVFSFGSVKIDPGLWVLPVGGVGPMAERVYCADAATVGRAEGARALEIRGGEARHLVRVRRVGIGGVVEVFDGLGFARRAEVIDVTGDRVALRLVGPPLPDRAPALDLTLATAVPKGDRFDWLVEKAVELGVAALVPVLTERSVVDPRAAKLDRLRRAVVEAAKQCGRNRLMTLAEPTSWADLLGDADPDALRLVAHPAGSPFPCWPRPRRAVSAVVAVGPEGGFTDDEVATAQRGGWVMVALGPTLLRVETAGLVASARILALAEDGTETTSGPS